MVHKVVGATAVGRDEGAVVCIELLAQTCANSPSANGHVELGMDTHIGCVQQLKKTDP